MFYRKTFFNQKSHQNLKTQEIADLQLVVNSKKSLPHADNLY